MVIQKPNVKPMMYYIRKLLDILSKNEMLVAIKICFSHLKISFKKFSYKTFHYLPGNSLWITVPNFPIYSWIS